MGSRSWSLYFFLLFSFFLTSDWCDKKKQNPKNQGAYRPRRKNFQCGRVSHDGCILCAHSCSSLIMCWLTANDDKKFLFKLVAPSRWPHLVPVPHLTFSQTNHANYIQISILVCYLRSAILMILFGEGKKREKVPWPDTRLQTTNIIVSRVL